MNPWERDSALGLYEQLNPLCEVRVRVPHRERAADHVIVSAEVLGRALDDDVCAERERLLRVRREEGIVRDEECAVRVGNGGECADIP